MSVARRLYLLMFSAIVGLAGLAGLALLELDRVYTAANFTNVNVVPSLALLDTAFTEIARIRAVTWQHIVLTDPAKKEEVAHKINAAHAKVLEMLGKYENYVADDEDKRLLIADRDAIAAYDALREKVMALSDAQKDREARDLVLANQQILDGLSAVFEQHRQYNARLANQS